MLPPQHLRTRVLTKVQLSERADDAVFFKATSPFDLFSKHLTEVGVLVQRLPVALIMTLFKR